jgi:hypothetical protein
VDLRGECFAQAGSGLAPIGGRSRRNQRAYDTGGAKIMNIFYIIGVVVVILFVLGYFGLR